METLESLAPLFLEKYERTIRVVRLMQPDLTVEDAMDRVMFKLVADCLKDGDTLETATELETFARKQFVEAWRRSEIIPTNN